jgi:hypothetical protein
MADLNGLWLDPMPESLRSGAITALCAGDVEGFFCAASNEYSLDLLSRNMSALQDAGLYERALLLAFTATRTNNSRWPLGLLRFLFEVADRAKLLDAGDPLPVGDRFTLYRGVAGRGRARRVRGLSWTSDPDKARWFAQRFGQRLGQPAVFSAVVERAHIYAHWRERKEDEYVVLLPVNAKVKRHA